MAWHDLSRLPKQYDVIWCRFPHRPDVSIPKDPPHPVVVRQIERNDRLGEAIVHVTYGTGDLKPERGQIDLLVESGIEMHSAGLRLPTRFDLDDAYNQIPCLWNEDFFPNWRPCGALDANCIRRLENRLRWRAEAAAKSKAV
jgi:hypothetical protein